LRVHIDGDACRRHTPVQRQPTRSVLSFTFAAATVF
jgi:hypothetical protein